MVVRRIMFFFVVLSLAFAGMLVGANAAKADGTASGAVPGSSSTQRH